MLRRSFRCTRGTLTRASAREKRVPVIKRPLNDWSHDKIRMRDDPSPIKPTRSAESRDCNANSRTTRKAHPTVCEVGTVRRTDEWTPDGFSLTTAACPHMRAAMSRRSRERTRLPEAYRNANRNSDRDGVDWVGSPCNNPRSTIHCTDGKPPPARASRFTGSTTRWSSDSRIRRTSCRASSR